MHCVRQYRSRCELKSWRERLSNEAEDSLRWLLTFAFASMLKI